MASTLEQMLPILAQLSQDRGTRRSLAELASSAGRSTSHFQRAFSRIVGESPKQYTRRLQLECAAVLLATTDDSVLDVALAAGFSSHEGFTRAFGRHFGRPPKEFRTHAAASGLTDGLRHADLLTHVGPCLRLFRTPSSPTTPSITIMNYDITTQPFEQTTYLCKSARCAHAEIAQTLGQILPVVFQYCAERNIEMTGPPTTIYRHWGPGMVSLQAGIPVANGTPGTDEIEAVVLPAGPAAVTIHTGSYDGLGDAHAAVEVHLHEQGLVCGGPLREVYLTDPGEVPNPDEWKTQIIWPVEP